ncbi:MAG: hypothetical protein ACI8RZ_003938 [Myxococcota bacterium]|jgi:hypothetical protein
MLILLAMPALAAPKCASTKALTAQEGIFTDGSKLSADYDNGQSLCWSITPSCLDEGRVTLWFDRMEVEHRYDFVQVFDASGRLLGKSAGTETTYMGTGFTVWFSSDESTTDLGFTAHYACEGIDDEGELEIIEDVEE